jgi:transcription initiation factor TFIIIB Brf1 subunit/transcription initiation factor TFIIB
MEKETSDFVQTVYLCVCVCVCVIKGVVCGVNWLAFRTETVSGHCEVVADFLHIVQMHFVLLGRAVSQTVCRWLFAA